MWGLQVTGRTLITGSADGTVRFWDVETTELLHLMDMVRRICAGVEGVGQDILKSCMAHERRNSIEVS